MPEFFAACRPSRNLLLAAALLLGVSSGATWAWSQTRAESSGRGATTVGADSVTSGGELEGLYRRLFELSTAMERISDSAEKDNLRREIDALHQRISGLREELRRRGEEPEAEERSWSRLDRELRRAAQEGDVQHFNEILQQLLQLLAEVGGEFGQQMGNVQVEISADRFRLATEGGGYIDVKIPPEVRENLKNKVGNLNVNLSHVLSDSMLEELDRAVREYSRSGNGPWQFLEKWKSRSRPRKWKVIGSSVFKSGSSFTVRHDELVKGDVVLIGGPLIIEGKVLGKAVCLGGDIELGEEGVVEGDVVSLGGDVLRKEGSTVGGKVVEFGRMAGSFSEKSLRAPALTFLILLLRLAVMAVLAALLLALANDRVQSVCEQCSRGFFRPFVEGMFWLVAAVLVFTVVIVTLALTIIGIPVALLVAVVFGALLLSAYLITCRLLGDRLWSILDHRRAPTPWQSTLLGLVGLELPALLLVILVMITGNDVQMMVWPRTVDLLLKFLVLSLGFGCVMRSRFGRVRGASRGQPAGMGAQTLS